MRTDFLIRPAHLREQGVDEARRAAIETSARRVPSPLCSQRIAQSTTASRSGPRSGSRCQGTCAQSGCRRRSMRRRIWIRGDADSRVSDSPLRCAGKRPSDHGVGSARIIEDDRNNDVLLGHRVRVQWLGVYRGPAYGPLDGRSRSGLTTRQSRPLMMRYEREQNASLREAVRANATRLRWHRVDSESGHHWRAE